MRDGRAAARQGTGTAGRGGDSGRAATLVVPCDLTLTARRAAGGDVRAVVPQDELAPRQRRHSERSLTTDRRDNPRPARAPSPPPSSRTHLARPAIVPEQRPATTPASLY